MFLRFSRFDFFAPLSSSSSNCFSPFPATRIRTCIRFNFPPFLLEWSNIHSFSIPHEYGMEEMPGGATAKPVRLTPLFEFLFSNFSAVPIHPPIVLLFYPISLLS